MSVDRRGFLRLGTAACAAGPLLRSKAAPRARHTALYVYTRPFVRARHVAVVEKAIARRAAAHVSGWQIDAGRPVHALGPVRGAAHWKGDRITKTIWAAWPFAAVLEYTDDGDPHAWIDWYRRRRGSDDDGAWFLDPAGIYVDHINAETVCHHDDDLCYMAVVDTPTGDVPGSNEFAIRGRVHRDGDARAHHGQWVRFDTPRGVRVEDWREHCEPLVDWRLQRRDSKLGWIASARVPLDEDRLAVRGTDRVFRLPSVPTGVTPCRGRPR